MFSIMCGSQSEHRNCCCRGLKSFIQPRILLRIAQKPMYGYELLESMEKTPHPGAPDTGGLYRLLRSMEDEGLLKSSWDTSESGPARRIYSITPMGENNLKQWIQSLRDTKSWLDNFLFDYEEYAGKRMKEK
jgi:PadR family transcriptional regulator, regulatory protein PadR